MPYYSPRSRNMPMTPYSSGSGGRIASRVLRQIPIVGSAVEGIGLARDLFNAGRSLYSRATQTRSSRTRNRRSQTTLARTARARTYRNFPIPPGNRIKLKKLKKLTKKYNYDKGSYRFSNEVGGTIDSTISTCLGHITCPRVYMLRALFACIVRRLLVSAGFRCAIPNRVVEGLSGGELITMTFEYGSATIDGFTYSIVLGNTFTQIVDGVVNAWVTKLGTLSSLLWGANVRVYKAEFLPTAASSAHGRRMLDLTDAKVQVKCNSILKIQNRSVGETGDEQADEVDNVPVQGRIYSGWGTGPDSRYQTDGATLTQLHGDTTTGLISRSNPENLSEAPPATLFRGVGKGNYVKIMPGQINRSYLNFTKTYKIADLFRMVSVATSDGNTAIKWGKFAFCILEKTLETNIAAPQTMSLAYEHNLTMQFKLINQNADTPVPEFFRS